MRSKRASSFSACSRTASGMPASSIFARYSSATEPSSSPSSLRIDSICLRRKYSRCCFWAPLSTSSRMRLAHLHLGEALALELHGQLEPLGHVDRLEQLDLLLEGEVGRVARGVGERARLGDRAQEGRDAAVVAAVLEDLLDHGAVLALELARAAVARLVVRVLLDLDAQGAARIGLRGADDAAVEPVELDGAAAARQADLGADLGDRADLRVGVLVARHEQHALLVADVHGQGDAHVREHDDVLEGDQRRSVGISASVSIATYKR